MEHRFYPVCCQSAYCGKINCPTTCRNLPALLDFKAWQEKHAAVKPDPIWSPSYWEATR